MTAAYLNKCETGYTLIELISVLVIAGILAAVAVPRFAGRDSFAEAGFFEQSLAVVRYAQKLSIGSGCPIQVSFSASGDSYALTRWVGCAQCVTPNPSTSPVADPSGSGTLAAVAPSGVDVGGNLDFYFDRIGRPHDLTCSPITNINLLRVNIGGRTLEVTPETGYVREN